MPLTITIIKPKAFKQQYEFYEADRKVAELKSEGSLGKKFIAAFGNLQWHITRKGFWKPLLEITAQQSPYSKIRVAYKWNYKLSVRSEDGSNYLLATKGFWKRTWFWTDNAGNMLIEFKVHPFSSKKSGSVLIYRPEKEISFFLMLLGWYQLKKAEQAAAVAAAT